MLQWGWWKFRKSEIRLALRYQGQALRWDMWLDGNTTVEVRLRL